ncbi:uncharacterized protein LOC117181554 [Belonocnema kinseyi]|uniref:uncharacterized protein LOC117181554 n=1 Tax=Belonocnema kinseyi TaxID=2817044 RepID=UPI00143CD5B7|nr:uncharacterized protein LOC117181554 [Belonocnema kinseyi]
MWPHCYTHFLKELFWCGLQQTWGDMHKNKNIKKTSSALIRQKRASSSSRLSRNQPDPSPETPALSVQNPLQQIPEGCVRIMKNGQEVGLGVIVAPRTIVTKASIFNERARYRFVFYQNGKLTSREVEGIKPNRRYNFILEGADGENDVCMADTSKTEPEMPKKRFVSKLIRESGIFKHTEQIRWIFSRTGCSEQDLFF